MIEFIGLLVGLTLGFVYPLHFPDSMTLYVGVALLGALDSALGGVRSRLKGHKKPISFQEFDRCECHVWKFSYDSIYFFGHAFKPV